MSDRRVIRAPRGQSPKPGDEIEKREEEREPARNDSEPPQHRDEQRNERTIAKRGKDEAFRIHATANRVEHADSGDEHTGNLKHVRSLQVQRETQE